AAVRPILTRGVGYRVIARDIAALSVPIMLTFGTFAATWWYVVIHNAPEATTAAVSPATKATAVPTGPAAPTAPAAPTPAAPATSKVAAAADEKPQELGVATRAQPQRPGAAGGSGKAA